MARRRIESNYPFQELRVPGTVTREKDCSRWVFICPRCNWSKIQVCPDPKAKRIGHYCENCHMPFVVYIGYTVTSEQARWAFGDKDGFRPRSK